MSGRAAKARLGRVGLASINAKYPSEAAAMADPVGAMQVAKDAMAAVLGVPSAPLIASLRSQPDTVKP